MPRPRKWTDEQFIAAVADSKSLKEVQKRLGITPGKYDNMRMHIRRLGIDASHIPLADAGVPRTERPRRSWTDDDLRAAVAESTTTHDVLRKLGYDTNGGMYRFVVAHIRRLELSTDHFLGQQWARGRTFPARRKASLEATLVKGSGFIISSGNLRKRLIAAGLKPDHCERCGLNEWQGEPLPLQLDHINGDHTDNRLENLRILCPNCHALTDTWCGKNKGKAGVLQRQRDMA